MKKDKTIYNITVEDIYTVAMESQNRKPTKEEIAFIQEKVGDYIVWYDIIDNLLDEYEREQSKK